MNNVLFSISLPIILINLILFLFSLYIHETGHQLYRLKFTYFPKNSKIIFPDAIGTFLIPLFSVFSFNAVSGYSRMNHEDHDLSFKNALKIFLAGPFANLIIFCLLLILSKLLLISGFFNYKDVLSPFIKNVIIYFAAVQLIFVLINFLPIPPLDAGQFLMKALNVRGEIFGVFGGFSILVLVYFGILKWLSFYAYKITLYLLNFLNLWGYLLISAILVSLIIYFFYPISKQKVKNKEQTKNKEKQAPGYVYSIVKSILKTGESHNLENNKEVLLKDNGLIPELYSVDISNSKKRESIVKHKENQNFNKKIQIAKHRKTMHIQSNNLGGEKECENLFVKRNNNNLKQMENHNSEIKIKPERPEKRSLKEGFSRKKISRQDKRFISKTKTLVEKLLAFEILNETELILFRKIKNIDYCSVNLCNEIVFKLKSNLCQECINYKQCLARAFRNVDLRDTFHLLKINS